jgi:hypothetical protein
LGKALDDRDGSCIAVLTAFTATPAIASTSYGDLNNFDVFNDTGTDCHGFEIELDDVHSTDITYTYDYNHYGTPKITEDNSDAAHPKVFVRYAATFDATSGYSAYTAIPLAPPAATDGHQCTDPSVNFGCEHFGVGYFGAPTVVRYNWLVDDPAAPGSLIHGPAVNVSTPSWTYYRPAPPSRWHRCRRSFWRRRRPRSDARIRRCRVGEVHCHDVAQQSGRRAAAPGVR